MLKAQNLGQRYGKGPWLFENLTMQVAPGQVLAVLGPNARGKTTLLKTLAGILPPAKGSVEREGVVGYVPQAHQTSLSYPVIEMAIMGRASKLRAYQSPGEKDKAIAKECLGRVGMLGLAERPFNHLSGGQKQLVLIARALATQPSTLVLDEPASALDLRNQALVMHVVRQLAREGIGLVVTTHDPGHAKYVANKVLLMDSDTVPVQGQAEALLTSTQLSQLYNTPIIVSDIETQDRRQRVVVPDLYTGEDENISDEVDGVSELTALRLA
ncbi:MAG: ABC transporter ATP-binding protein [Actinomycetaceae bacterium]|nr:ABC transporter ATP-binding protein [Actinomycetaceae bacterium]